MSACWATCSARAFSQFLNPANIGDQHYFQGVGMLSADGLATTLAELADRHGNGALQRVLECLRIELVLTTAIRMGKMTPKASPACARFRGSSRGPRSG
jgi:phosphoenolpyruvate carboxylase